MRGAFGTRRRGRWLAAAAGWIGGFVATTAAAGLELARLPDGTLVMRNDGAPAVASRGTPRRGERAAPAAYADLVREHAARQGLDPRLVHAVITTESAYDAAARSRKGALGLMQLMPQTAARLAVANPLDPVENLRGGTTYLRQLLDLFAGRLDLALAGYNAGPEAVERHGGVPPYRETRQYVERVLALYDGGHGGRGRPVVLTRAPGGELLLTNEPAGRP